MTRARLMLQKTRAAQRCVSWKAPKRELLVIRPDQIEEGGFAKVDRCPCDKNIKPVYYEICSCCQINKMIDARRARWAKAEDGLHRNG